MLGSVMAEPVQMPDLLEKFGFTFKNGSVHTKRTMMLNELVMVLEELPIQAKPEEYLNAIDVYSKHPSERKLANEGVASVNDEKTSQAYSVLRYELETFVCDGQYERGMAHILDTYLKNLSSSAAQQPGVWISGFFGKVTFRQESTNVTTPQRIQIRKLFQAAGFSQVKNGEELVTAPRFIEKLMDLSESAGGEAPKPKAPDTNLLSEIRLSAGNAQLLGLYNARDELSTAIAQWESTAKLIAARWPLWQKLKALSHAAKDLNDYEVIQSQIDAIEKHRQLLDNPDPLTPLIKSLTEALREELNQQKQAWETTYSVQENRLETDSNFMAMEPEERFAIRKPLQLIEDGTPIIEVSDIDAILKTLERTSLSALRDRIAALPSRFQSAKVAAAKAREPKVQQVRLDFSTLKTEADIDAWLQDVRLKLVAQLKNGPVLPH
jgi:hypothetical protein